MSDSRKGMHLENYRANGQSFDEFVGEAGTFNASRNIDIFSKMKGICIAPKEEENDGGTMENVECYCIFSERKLYKLVQGSADNIELRVSDGTDFSTFGTLEFTIDQSSLGIVTADRGTVLNAVVFTDKVFVLCDKQVFQYDVATTTVTVVTPTGRYDSDTWIIPSFNYHQTLLIVAKNDKVRTYDPALGVAIGRNQVRDFSQGVVVGLLQYDELIGICVNHNGIDSRIYVLGSNFDVDDIGVLDTIPLPGISVMNTGQMGARIFLTAQDNTSFGRGVAYELIGKIPVPIKESRNGANVKSATNPSNTTDFDFKVRANSLAGNGLMTQSYPVKGTTLYIPTIDGIRAYGRPNYKVNEAVYMFHAHVGSANAPIASCIFQDYLYVCHAGSECRYYLGKDTSIKRYQESGNYLLGRKYSSDFMSMEKEILNCAISYNLPSANSKITVWLRFNDGSWSKAFEITDHEKAFKIIEPTGENLISNIRGDWNYFDYAIELETTDDTETPSCREIAFFYDYVRNKL